MIRAVVFDAYGTLFDVQSLARQAEALFPGHGAELGRQWRTRQLEYSWLRTLMGEYADFEQLTADALRATCDSLGLALPESAFHTLLGAYRTLPPYPEVRRALAALEGLPLAILSNGSPAMLEAVVAHAGLGPHFQAVLSVDALRLYKPHPAVYQMAADQFGASAAEIAFLSANSWDIAGATAFGFRTGWVRRAAQAPERLGQSPTRVLADLEQVPGLIAQ